jgi:hypothetical protein
MKLKRAIKAVWDGKPVRRVNPWPLCLACRHRVPPPLCVTCGNCETCCDKCTTCGNCVQGCPGHRQEDQK